MLKQGFRGKMGLGQIFSESWDVYTKQIKPIALLTLLIYIPINIISYFVKSTVTDELMQKLYLNGVQIIEGLLAVIATMGIAVIVAKAVNGEENVSFEDALRSALSRWLSCIGTSVLAGLIVFGLMLLLIVPGIIWSLYYAFIVQVVVLKSIGGKKALNYSKALVKGNWWGTFGVLFVLGLATLVPALIIGVISGFLPEMFGIVAETGVDIVLAFTTVGTTVLFINKDYLKNGINQEAFDNNINTEPQSSLTDVNNMESQTISEDKNVEETQTSLKDMEVNL